MTGLTLPWVSDMEQNNFDLVLVSPTMEYEQQAISFIDEVLQTDLDENIRFAGFALLNAYRDNYGDWLKYLEKMSDEVTVVDGRVPANTFFAIRKTDNKIVGIIDIRRRLNDYLFLYAGHIGYTVLPSERQKGYGYQQLILALDFCKSVNISKVLIMCADYNVASYKTIEKAGGILETQIPNPHKNVLERRYWINI